MEQITIRKDRPMPERKRAGGKRTLKYPFEVLNVGESFHIPAVDGDIDKVMRRASGSVFNAKKRFEDRKFEVRRAVEGDPDGPGACVFRTA